MDVALAVFCEACFLFKAVVVIAVTQTFEQIFKNKIQETQPAVLMYMTQFMFQPLFITDKIIFSGVVQMDGGTYHDGH